jgi:hypothetical protein
MDAVIRQCGACGEIVRKLRTCVSPWGCDLAVTRIGLEPYTQQTRAIRVRQAAQPGEVPCAMLVEETLPVTSDGAVAFFSRN